MVCEVIFHPQHSAFQKENLQFFFELACLCALTESDNVGKCYPVCLHFTWIQLHVAELRSEMKLPVSSMVVWETSVIRLPFFFASELRAKYFIRQILQSSHFYISFTLYWLSFGILMKWLYVILVSLSLLCSLCTICIALT